MLGRVWIRTMMLSRRRCVFGVVNEPPLFLLKGFLGLAFKTLTLKIATAFASDHGIWKCQLWVNKLIGAHQMIILFMIIDVIPQCCSVKPLTIRVNLHWRGDPMKRSLGECTTLGENWKRMGGEQSLCGGRRNNRIYWQKRLCLGWLPYSSMDTQSMYNCG